MAEEAQVLTATNTGQPITTAITPAGDLEEAQPMEAQIPTPITVDIMPSLS